MWLMKNILYYIKGKKKLDCRKTYTSISLWVYLAVALASVAFIFCGVFEGKLWTIIANIGYGILGSIVVSAIIDFANTKRTKEEDEKHAEEIFANYRGAFLDLRDSVIVNDYTWLKKRTFEEWMRFILDELEGEEQEDKIADITCTIERITQEAEKLISAFPFLLSNKAISKQYRQDVKKVKSASIYISDLFMSGKYEQGYRTISRHLLKIFLKCNENMRGKFTDPYDEDSWLEGEE